MRHLNAQTWLEAEVVDAAADRSELDRYNLWRLEHAARKDGRLKPNEQFGEGLTEWIQVKDAKVKAEAEGHPWPPTHLGDDDWLVFITVPIVER